MQRTLTLVILLSFIAAPAAAAPNQTAQADLVNPGLVPGDFFYPVEQFVEKIEVAVAGAPVIGSNEFQAKVRANNAEERLSEARGLANKGDNSERVSALMKEYRTQLNLATKGFARENKTNLSRKMIEISNRHTRVLQEVRQKVPPQAQDAIDQAMERSRSVGKDLKLPEQAAREQQRPGKSGKEKPGDKGRSELHDEDIAGEVSGRTSKSPEKAPNQSKVTRNANKILRFGKSSTNQSQGSQNKNLNRTSGIQNMSGATDQDENVSKPEELVDNSSSLP